MTLHNLMMGWPLVIGIATVCAIIALLVWSRVKFTQAETIAVQGNSRMLSVAERKLFECLVEALADKYFIFIKVGLSSFIEPSPDAKWLNLIQVRRELDTYNVDFIVCKQADMSVFAVVELERTGRTVDAKAMRKGQNYSAKRKRRDTVIRRVCKSSDLKLFYFDVRPDYQGLDICQLITGRPKGDSSAEDHLSPTHQSQLTIDHSRHSTSAYARSCPKCRSEVVTKISIKGRNIGEKFLMCRKYPYCDYRVAKKDLVRVNPKG